MSCKIVYNGETPVGVEDPRTGKRSELFDEIMEHPIIKDFNDALDMYKNSLSGFFAARESSYMVRTRVDGEVMRYREALKTNSSNIEIGFLDNSGKFTPLRTIRPNFDETTNDGFINSFIKQGIISDQKKVVNGVAYFQPRGYSQAATGIRDMLIGEQALINLGWKNFQRTPNGYTFIQPEETTPDRVQGILQEEIRTVLKENTNLKEEENTNKLDENELKLRLLDLLSSLGINVMSISDYVSKYKIKNGVEPNAKALADIANKVVAFQDGNIGIEELTEEVAHFIVEGWNQEDIANLLRNIHRTPEWGQFAAEYREVYSKNYSGEQLEQAVRREVLGKVLANSLKNNFSTEAKTETQTNIINRIQQLFRDFVNFIINRINPNFRQDLETFTEEVNDLLYEKQLKEYLNQDNYDNNTFVLYKTGGASTKLKGMRANVLKALNIAQQNIKTFSKSKNTSFSDKASLDRNIRKLTQLADTENLLAQKQAALEMLSVASTQINQINATIKETRDTENFVFGVEENAKFENLTKNLNPLLGEIKNNIETNPNTYPKKEWKQVVETINEVQAEINDLESRASNIYNEIIENDLVERVMQKHNLGEEYRQHITEWMQAAKADTSLFHRHFGQITNSRDPLLGLASDTIERIFNGSNQEFVPRAKRFQEELRALGIKESDLKKLFNKGFLLDVTDHAAVEQRLKEIRATARLKATGTQIPTEEEINETIEKARKDELEELDVQQKEEFDRLMEEAMVGFTERPFTEKYYQDRKEKYENLNIAQTSQTQIKSYSAERGSLIREAIREDGTIDWSRLSLSSEEHLHALKRKRKRDKSLTTSNGELKTGLSTTTNADEIQQQIKDKTAVEVNSVWYYLTPQAKDAFPNDEARLALDLHKLDQDFVESLQGVSQEVEVPQSFIDEVEEIEGTRGKEAALRFIELNSTISFNQSFWDEISEGGNYMDRVIEAADNLEAEERQEVYKIVENIRLLKTRLNNTLKQFDNSTKPNEIDATKMGSITKEAIRELDEDIQSQYSALSKLVKLEATEESNPISLNQANEAYMETVREEDMTVQEELEFIFKNSSSSARDRVERFRKGIREYLEGKTSALPPSQARFVDNLDREGVSEDRYGTPEEYYLIEYARTQLSSYYKQFSPIEYNNITDVRETGTASEYLSELINAQYVNIRPDHSFLEGGSDYKNNDYDPNYEGGIQPKKGKFVSQEYINMFAPNSNGEPTKNQKLYDALQLVKDLQRESLENVNLSGRHSIYKLPQITQKGVDRVIKTFSRKGGIKQAWNEAFTYRVDDLEYGQSIQGVDVSTIPTYYTHELEDSRELTDELFYSFTAMYQQSVLHKHRRNGIGEMLAIKDALGKRDYPKGKAAEATNTIRMFKNYMDYAIFGKQETQEFKITIFGKKVDLTKFARNLLDFIKFRNLGFSPIVAATSWFTAEVNMQIEKSVKEIINPQSERLGRREYFKLAGDAMKEVGKLQSKSKLNTLGEFFGMYNLSERFESSNYGWLGRNTKNMGWAVHQMANFPITPRAMLSVLYDNKVVNGVIINFNQYKQQQKTIDPNKTNKDIERDWKEEKEYIYNYLEVTPTTVKFNNTLKSKLNTEYATDNYLQTKMEGLTQQIQNAVTKLDQQITPSQRVAAQRHFAMNYLMTHRSWLSINISNRTKNAHYNLNSGMHEEGSYRSFLKFLQDSLIDFVKNKNIKAFKDAWNGEGLETDGNVPFETLLATRRRNMRRVAVDSVWLMGVAAVAYALLNFSDDDEDNYALQMTSYLALRTLNETVSSQSALPLQFYEVLESPFVGLNTAKDMVVLPYNIFNSEVVKSGRYKGETHRMRNIKKVMPGLKVIDDVSKAQNTKDNYFYYNKNNIMASPVVLMEMAFGEENN